METVDMDAMEFDTGHSIELIASVSFDRKRKQFKYSEGLDQIFGAEMTA